MIRKEIIREAKDIIEFAGLDSRKDLKPLLKVFFMEDLTEKEIIEIENLLLEKEEEEERFQDEMKEAEQEAIKEWDDFLKDINNYWRETRL